MMCSRNSIVNLLCDRVDVVGVYRVYFDNLSTITRIASYPCDWGRPVIRPRETTLQGRVGIQCECGHSSPFLPCRPGLIFWQTSQEWQNCSMSFHMEGQ